MSCAVVLETVRMCVVVVIAVLIPVIRDVKCERVVVAGWEPLAREE